MSQNAQGIVAVVVIIAVAVLAYKFTARCLADLAETDDEDLLYMSRQAWLILIVVGIPWGGVLYLLRGKAR